MNYLGHAFLSTAETFLGNMAGDSLKGIRVDSLSERVRRGIAIHVLIDRLTDSHPLFRSAAACFSAQRLPYAGVLADISLDYALASRWEEFSGVEWFRFKHQIYRRLLDERTSLPGSFQYSAYWLVQEDWFESYRSLEGMETAFYRLSRKTRRPVDPTLATEVLSRNRGLFAGFAEGLIPAILRTPELKPVSELISKPCISLQSG